MLRSTLIGAAAGAAALGCAGAAAAEVATAGHAAARVGRVEASAYGADETVTSYAVDGAVVLQFSSRYNFQLDGSFKSWDASDLGLDDVERYSGDAHMFWGPLNAYTVGGFASVADVDLEGLTDETVYGGGLELDLYDDAWTTSMQAGMFVGDDNFEVLGASGQARFYPSPRFSLEGSAAYGSYDQSMFDTDSYGVGAEAEYQFSGTAVSVFGGATYSKLADFDVDASALSVGVRFSFGSRSLLERDRTGASMRGSQKMLELLEP